MFSCSLGNFLPLGNDYLLLSYKSLKINVDSALDSRGSPSMILDLLGI